MKYLCFQTFSLVIFSVLMATCGQISEPQSIDQVEVRTRDERVELRVEGYLEIPVDSLTSNVTHLAQYYSAGDLKLLCTYNKNLHAIDFYNIESKSLFKRINLLKEGPNSFPNSYGFFIHNLDSIFLIDSYSRSVALIDSSKNIYFNYKDFHDSENSLVSVFPYVSTRYKPIYQRGKLIIKGMSQVNPSNLQEYIRTAENMITFDLLEKKYTSWLNFPHIYERNAYLSLDYELQSFCAGKQGNIIFSFPGSSSLYLTESNKIVREIIHNYDLPKIESAVNRHQKEQMLENPYYAAIFADSYNGLFYRIIYKPLNTFPKGKYGHSIPRDFIITVYKGDIEIIAQFEIDKSEMLLPEFSFITEQGLCIYQIQGNEDLMKFKILKFDVDK